jgi:hypothetical protein
MTIMGKLIIEPIKLIVTSINVRQIRSLALISLLLIIQFEFFDIGLKRRKPLKMTFTYN